ncbi:hypothetical protein, conserved [Trypanosoma brucei gambiense DAL972]|uniref:Uncharacterized protein n=1 Tax=Trypanosoma brucei gambiense (strain MHOM/CI/86/DAL972) TaxID=679716 RepID=C9ZTX2_TRYB9|nr:hypothetical protein, conserved [Trypanosoma brucei gambiense DAL972]CBH12858.1 hypothetical protein, conserved [Trypanosoma brucei gambiense DAL972]|eukprot:XP_011775137.1 hypothetical protein, conserved [Trypanosoma brucei gambiense DAL972]
MPVANEASSFNVLYALNKCNPKRRRWMNGWLYVNFDRATLVDGISRKAVGVVSGTGLLPNKVFKMMVEADNGAAWEIGTEVVIGQYITQIEGTTRLHLIPYTLFSGVDCIDDNAAEEVSSVELAGSSMTSRVVNVTAGFSATRADAPLSRRKTTEQLISELRGAYPQIFI